MDHQQQRRGLVVGLGHQEGGVRLVLAVLPLVVRLVLAVLPLPQKRGGRLTLGQSGGKCGRIIIKGLQTLRRACGGPPRARQGTL